MTLHWWMHWFWVTAQIVACLTSLGACESETSPTPSIISSVATEAVPLVHSSSPAQPAGISSAAGMHQYETTETLARLQQSYRIAKAIGIRPTTTADSSLETPPQSIRNLQQQQQWGRIGSTAGTPAATDGMSGSSADKTDDKLSSTQAGRIPGKKETKITWIHAFSKPPRLKTSSPMPPAAAPSSEAPTAEELTVMPLQEDLRSADSKALLDPNAIRREQLQLPPANRSDGSQQQLVGQEGLQPHAVATAASILEAGLVDSTRLGRARGTFTSEFQRDQLKREEQSNGAAIKETAASPGANVTEIATITGSCLAIIILFSTLGSVGFVMYRRRYLNPPQTLNSDKCSNPDSSGYIDDSTIRDNSEEMYSLDNDSFLNSLEAMTIQNYWTDSVKHTKL